MLWSNISYCRATLLLILSCLVVLVQAQESTSQAQGTIKVGILHSVTGTMAISEAALRDTMLMLIEEQNAKGGVLGKQLEPIVYNPRSNWPLYAQQARQMIELNEVAVIFGCWTSASRKAVLPVVEELAPGNP